MSGTLDIAALSLTSRWSDEDAPRSVWKLCQAWADSVGFAQTASMGSARMLGSSCIHAFRGVRGKQKAMPEAAPVSGALALSCGSCCAMSRAQDQVMGGATEDEQQVHLFQSTYLD